MRAYTYDERCAKFGSFKFTHSPTPTNLERIVIAGGWSQQNISDIEVPELKAKFRIDKVNVHTMAVDALKSIWAAWNKAGLLPNVKTFNGLWVPRMKRGKGESNDPHDVSAHSWGLAFDIDAGLNPQGTVPSETDPIRQLLPLAEQFGWFWGGHFHSVPDPEHFEIGNPVTVVETNWIQNVINKLGAGSVAVDGKLGPRTMSAWSALCKLRNLDSTILHVASPSQAEINDATLAFVKGLVP